MTDPSMSEFQQAFVRALWRDPSDDSWNASPPWITAPGFAVYRNTVMKACLDALEANFPAVARLSGSEWFRSVAALFVRAHPPQDPRLMCYGTAFAAFLATFESASALPYLPDVARLDCCWTEAHTAADAQPARAAWLGSLSPAVLGDTRLPPHPATRWAWFEAMPIYSIWSRNRVPSARHDGEASSANACITPGELVWQGEGALLTRPDSAVIWSPLSRGGCAFLDACSSGATLAEAAQIALAHEADLDIAALLSHLLKQGALLQST